MIDYKGYVKELFGIFRKYYAFVIGIIVFLMIMMFIEIMLLDMSTGSGSEIPINALIYMLNAVIQLGLFKIAYNMSNNENVDFLMLFNSGGLLFNFIITSFLYMLMVFAGAALLIIPGIVIAVLFFPYAFIIIENNENPIATLKKSFKMTRMFIWQLFVIIIVLNFINIMGALAFYVGVTITLPFTVIAQAVLYKHLKEAINYGKQENIT